MSDKAQGAKESVLGAKDSLGDAAARARDKARRRCCSSRVSSRLLGDRWRSSCFATTATGGSGSPAVVCALSFASLSLRSLLCCAAAALPLATVVFGRSFASASAGVIVFRRSVSSQVMQEAREAKGYASSKAQGAKEAAAATTAGALGYGSDKTAEASYYLQEKEGAAKEKGMGATARALDAAEDAAADTSQYLADKADKMRVAAGEYEKETSRSKVRTTTPAAAAAGAAPAGGDGGRFLGGGGIWGSREEPAEEGSTLHFVALIPIPVHAARSYLIFPAISIALASALLPSCLPAFSLLFFFVVLCFLSYHLLFSACCTDGRRRIHLLLLPRRRRRRRSSTARGIRPKAPRWTRRARRSTRRRSSTPAGASRRTPPGRPWTGSRRRHGCVFVVIPVVVVEEKPAAGLLAVWLFFCLTAWRRSID